MEEEHIVPTKDELLELPQSAYKCHLCQTTVRTKSNLKVHMIKTHRILESASDMAFFSKKKSRVKKIFHCHVKQCKYSMGAGKGFHKFSALRQHYLWVHQKKMYACCQCGRTFPTTNHLSSHSRICGQVHACPQCNRTYRERKYLLSHMRTANHKEYGQVEPPPFPSQKAPVSKQKETGVDLDAPNTSTSFPTTSPIAPSNGVCILQPVYLPLMVPVSSVENARELALSSLQPLLAKLGVDTRQGVFDSPPMVFDPHAAQNAERSSSIAIQTENYILPSTDEHLQFAPSMPSIGVSTDLSLGLDEFDALMNSDFTQFLTQAASTNSHHHQQPVQAPQMTSTSGFAGQGYVVQEMANRGVVDFDYASAFSSTAMQTDSLLGPLLHVETQTWTPLQAAQNPLDDNFPLQDLETQTGDLESLLFNVETQTIYH